MSELQEKHTEIDQAVNSLIDILAEAIAKRDATSWEKPKGEIRKNLNTRNNNS